jgi:glycosyltransferase WbpL
LAARLVAVGFGVTVVLTPLLIAGTRRLGLLDRPQWRSSHTRVTPRGGGLALVAASLFALAVAGEGLSPEEWAFVAGGLLVAALGLRDDWRSLSPLLRLVGHTAAAALVVVAAGGLRRLPLPPPLDVPLGPLGAPLGVLWIVAVINFYNFLDGIDGLAALQGTVTGLGLLLAGWGPLASAMGAALAGACGAFLLFNWSPARIFMGDVGSGFLGYVFAAAPFLAPPDLRPPATLFVALSLWLFLADATFTLAWRVSRGRPWQEAHRDHLYQHIVMGGWSHRRMTLVLGVGAALLTALALGQWTEGSPASAWAVLSVAMLLFLAEWWLARRCSRARGYHVATGEAS